MSNLSQLFDAGRFPGGVEVRPDEKAAVMTLRGPENGSLRLVSLWEGVILSFNRIDTQVWPLAQAEANNILLLNFCQKGRCEVALDDGQFAFLSQGYMAVGTQQAQEEYCYPGSLYEGIELFLDLDKAGFIAANCNSHSGISGILSLSYCHPVNVITSSTEQS